MKFSITIGQYLVLISCYHDNAAIAFVWRGFHGDECIAVLFPFPPHPPSPVFTHTQIICFNIHENRVSSVYTQSSVCYYIGATPTRVEHSPDDSIGPSADKK